MNTQDSIRKLLSFDAGKPLPYGTTLHLPKRQPAETLVLAFVRMGGESRPWGVAIGRPDREPNIYTVPEARDRELVGEMLEKVTPILLAQMGHPGYVRNKKNILLPYVWLPNASHIEMLHFLAFTYTFAQRGNARRIKVLNALGRATNWLFQESVRPGQLSCIDASGALREAFTFPAENMRQAHTGYLMAWIESKGSFEARLSVANEAEQHAISTSLDPQIEKNELDKKPGLDNLVEKYNVAKRDGHVATMRKTATMIQESLEPELKHRFKVAVQAYRALMMDKRRVNAGIGELEKYERERHAEYIDVETKIFCGEKAWVKSPETERHSLIAASQYVTLEADRDRLISALIHDDGDLQEDFLISGDGLRGRIIKVETEVTGRKKHAIWTIEENSPRPLRIRADGVVVQAGYPKRKAELREIKEKSRGPRLFILEIVAGIREGDGPLGRDPLNASWKGKTVTFLNLNEPGFSFIRRRMLWDRKGPGVWLTHRQPWEDWVTSSGEDDNDSDAATP